MKNKKYLFFIFNFIFLILNFTLICYALDLSLLKASFLAGDYKTAIKEGEKEIASVTAQSSQLDELYYILALSYLKEGNLLRASDIFEIILGEFSNSRFKEQALLGLGDTYFMREDYAKAREHYAKLAENSRSKFKPQAYYRLAQCFLKLGDNRQGQSYMDKLKDEYPLSLELQADKGPEVMPQIYYTVQVGAFSSAINAKKLTEKLVSQGYPAYIQPWHAGYRVRVGKFISLEEARKLEAALIKEGHPSRIFP